MSNYKHGGDVYGAMRDLGLPLSALIDYSANINPLVDAAWIKALLEPYWEQVLHYPDPENVALTMAIANRFGVSPELVVLGNGATPLIHQLVETIKPDRARLCAPTFGEYGKALERSRVPVDYAYCDVETLQVDCAALADIPLARGERGMVFLCNPNNPTGQLTPVAEVIELLSKLPKNCYLIVDEAFIEFTAAGEANSMVAYLASYSNLVILRSATKFLGMPGLRLGYLLAGDPVLASALKDALPIWQVNVLAAGLYMEGMKLRDLRRRTVDFVVLERQHLREALVARGFSVWPSESNYFMVRPPAGMDLGALLYQQGILVRCCDNYAGLPKGLYRLAVKTSEDRAKLVMALDNFMEE